MNHIYTGLDIGNNEIKIVVVESYRDDYHVLASTAVKSKGIKKNTIYDEKKLKECLHQAITQTESTL